MYRSVPVSETVDSTLVLGNWRRGYKQCVVSPGDGQGSTGQDILVHWKYGNWQIKKFDTRNEYDACRQGTIPSGSSD